MPYKAIGKHFFNFNRLRKILFYFQQNTNRFFRLSVGLKYITLIELRLF